MSGFIQLGLNANLTTVNASRNIYCGSNGSSNTPCYSWGHDSNTGMYSLSNDVIGFSTGGVNRMIVGSNVGVGNVNPRTLLHVGGTTSIMSPVTTDGIVSYFPFEGTITDIVGQNSLSGTPGGYITGKIGNAVNFTQTGGVTQTQMLSKLNANLSVPLTISTWVNMGSGAIGIVFFVGFPGQTQFFAKISSTEINVNVYNSTQTPSYQTGKITGSFLTGTWYHIVCSLDSSLRAKLYVNGAYVATSQMNNVTWPSTNHLSFAGDYTDSSFAFNGLIDDARIYGRLLSDEEISQIYLNQVDGSSTDSRLGIATTNPLSTLHVAGAATVLNPVPSTNLITHYPFDGNANDVVGSRNLTGTPAGYVIGKVGQAVNFTQTPGTTASQRLNFNNFNITLPLSFSVWVNFTTTTLYQVPVLIGTGTSSLYLVIDAAPRGFGVIYNNWGVEDKFISGVSTATPFNVNTWFHTVVTCDASRNISLYINGIWLGSVSIAQPWSATNGVFVGGAHVTGGYSFQGLIDDLRIYNRVLSATEVNLIYQNQVGATNIYADSRLGVGVANPQHALDVAGIGKFNNVYCGTVGTSNAPCYSWGHDSNTGMYSLSNDVIGFATGGVNRMTVGSNVNLSSDAMMMTVTSPTIERLLTQQVAYYPFDASFNDAFGPYNLTATGTVGYSNGVYGTAARFTNTLNTVANTNFLSTTISCPNVVTVSFWFQTAGFATNVNQDFISMITNDDLICRIAGANQCPGLTYTGGGILSTFAVVANTWYHYVGIVSSATGGKLFINGALQGSDSRLPTVNLASSSFPMRVQGYWGFTGSIDDVRIFNKELTAAEVQLLYNTPPSSFTRARMGIATATPQSTLHVAGATTVLNPVPDAGLITHYPFDGNANDVVGGLNLTALGDNAANINYNVVGKVRTSVYFNNNIGQIPILQRLERTGMTLTLPMTFVFWFNADSIGVIDANQRILRAGALFVDIPPPTNASNPNGLEVWVIGNTSVARMASLSASTWYHVVVTVNTSNSTTLYVNGVQRGTGGGGTWTTSNATINLGSESATSPFKGYVDDLRIYNRVLSAAEINLIYQNQVGGTNVYADSRLGVGVANPQYALDVAGGARFTSDLVVPRPVWTSLTLSANLVNEDVNTFTTASYTKDSHGRVILRGVVRWNGASGAVTIATLPTGYRPLRVHIFGCIGSSGATDVRISSAGVITTGMNNNTWLSLDNITFSDN